MLVFLFGWRHLYQYSLYPNIMVYALQSSHTCFGLSMSHHHCLNIWRPLVFMCTAHECRSLFFASFIDVHMSPRCAIAPCCSATFTYLLTYLLTKTSSCGSTHKAATKERQCFLSAVNFVTWPQLYPSAFISHSTDLLHVSFGLPRALLPPGVQRVATLGIDINGILLTWPIHLHLRHLTSSETGWVPVLSWGSLFEILMGK